MTIFNDLRNLTTPEVKNHVGMACPAINQGTSLVMTGILPNPENLYYGRTRPCNKITGSGTDP